MKKSVTTAFGISALTLAAGAPVALGQDALLYINAAQEGHSRTAATAAGFSVTEVFDELTFISEMGSGSYDIAIYENPANFNDPGLAAAVTGYVSGGGQVHLCYWNLDADPALQAALGVASAVDIFNPEEIYDNAGHASWGSASSPVGLTGFSPWNDNGDYLTADASSEIVATHSSVAGPGATVVGNGDQTLVNGWEYDTKEAVGTVALLQAQMEWLLAGGSSENALVLDYNSINGIGASATAGAGLNPLVTTTPGDFVAELGTKAWRMVTIDNPSNLFDAPTSDAIASYIAKDGRVHMSYWNLDADPVLQQAFGVASAVDFFDPRPVFATSPTHPSWGGLVDVQVGPGPSPWADNGDTLTAASSCEPGAPEVIGVFDSAGSGEGAIVTAGGRTLVNGFDYDSMDLARVETLVTTQIRWLRTAEPTGGPGGGCYADCDGSGELDFFDFLCFQNAFSAGDCYADCDGSGQLDFFDFLCFQNEFAAGCPEGIDEFGVEAPPSVYCGTTMTQFPLDGRPVFTDVSTVPSPLGGDVTFSSACNLRQIFSGWASWSHGYTGSVYYTNGAASLDVMPPASSAFYFYVEPNPFSLIEFEITRDGGESVVDSIHGQSGAKGYGFCGGVGTANVRTTDGFTDFAIGEFGIAN